MPAVLTELGFISNAKDCAVLVSKSGQEQFARKLFNAFVAYKKEFESVKEEAVDERKVVQQSGGKAAASCFNCRCYGGASGYRQLIYR